ncbi:13300_t:CDS:2, partial [Cetraspora pellucida]
MSLFLSRWAPRIRKSKSNISRILIMHFISTCASLFRTHKTHESNESNSDLDEETSNNSELEVTTVSRGNRRGRGQPRLTRTNQGANNSRGNRGKRGKHSTDQVIVNCWRKTGILSSVSYEEIEVAIKSQDMLLEQQEEDVNDLVIDLTSQDPEIKSQLNTYLDLSNLHIITEEKLEDSEIIEIVIDEANQCKNGDPDDSDKEQPEISISEGLMGLNKFISFFEQQIDADFKAEDLKIFQKYLALLNRKYRESKRQASISDFFTQLNNEDDYD